LAGPGFMSFQSAKLSSAPNLNNSLPLPGALPWNHKALLNVDRGVESGSPATVLTGIGLKFVPMAVHCVTLPSFPNLNN
jgi:hypothetical protein